MQRLKKIEQLRRAIAECKAAKGKDWRNLSPKCPGVGKGNAPMHVTDKPALLHYVTGVMSQMRTATKLVIKIENEIKDHIIDHTV